MQSFEADFETTTDENDCRVWGWSLVECNIDANEDDVILGTSIESFILQISLAPSHCYLHNLGFDGSFIINYLFREGFEHVEGDLAPKQFNSLISDTGRYYSLTVCFENNVIVEFRNSLNKLPMSVDRIADSFKFDIKKTTIDYHEKRVKGHVLTDVEREYMANDVLIPAKALAMQFKENMNKLTVGADSLNEFKNLFGKQRFERLFPQLPFDIDKIIRRAYRGGWTYPDHRRQGRLIEEDGAVYDVNSLYPTVMRYEPMPWGESHYFPGKPPANKKYPFWFAEVTFVAKLKSDHVPCIQLSKTGIFHSPEYVHKVPEPIRFGLTNIDWELWNEHYDITIFEWHGGFMFQQCSGIFDEYILKWSSIKEQSTGGRREIAKLHLNTLYGKFATNPSRKRKIPTFVDDRIKFITTEAEICDSVFTPIGAIITANARAITIRAAQANYKHFAYADTDSIHLLTREQPKGIKIHNSELGAWKHEYNFVRSKFLRAKQYMEEEPSEDGEPIMHTHIAGLSTKVSGPIGFDDMEPGNTLIAKLLPKQVPGGIVLKEQTFTFK